MLENILKTLLENILNLTLLGDIYAHVSLKHVWDIWIKHGPNLTFLKDKENPGQTYPIVIIFKSSGAKLGQSMRKFLYHKANSTIHVYVTHTQYVEWLVVGQFQIVF